MCGNMLTQRIIAHRLCPCVARGLRRWVSLAPRTHHSLLKPYFWPTSLADRIRAVSCFVLLGLSKVCTCRGALAAAALSLSRLACE